MNQSALKEHEAEFAAAFAEALEAAIGSLDFDVRCLDWFSYCPDYYRALRRLECSV